MRAYYTLHLRQGELSTAETRLHRLPKPLHKLSGICGSPTDHSCHQGWHAQDAKLGADCLTLLLQQLPRRCYWVCTHWTPAGMSSWDVLWPSRAGCRPCCHPVILQVLGMPAVQAQHLYVSCWRFQWVLRRLLFLSILSRDILVDSHDSVHGAQPAW